jgi:hypothetical protein
MLINYSKIRKEEECMILQVTKIHQPTNNNNMDLEAFQAVLEEE